MRGKRSKQYRRLMEQHARGFGFREPYQVLIDAELVKDTTRCKMELATRLAQVLHGTIKPIITQCSMRHIYAAAKQDPLAGRSLIGLAQTFERRRCGHHPSEYPEPLSEFECIAGVVGATANKHRYVVASQHAALRRHLRDVPGVPLIYVNRSVMVMEPMARATAEALEQAEKAKFRGGLKLQRGVKRKRGDEKDVGEDGVLPAGGDISREHGEQEVGDGGGSGDEGADGLDGENDDEHEVERAAAPTQPSQERQRQQKQQASNTRQGKKRRFGPKEPNPLSVRKPKKRPI